MDKVAAFVVSYKSWVMVWVKHMDGEALLSVPKHEILSIAHQFLAGQLEVIATARALAPFRHDVESELKEILLTFTAIDSETDTLPLAPVREYWSADVLERKDREIAEAEDFYRNTAIQAATRLVRLLDPLH